MNKTKQGFIIPLLLVIIGLLALGGGAYVYTHLKLTQGLEKGHFIISTSTVKVTTDSNPTQETSTSDLNKPIDVSVAPDLTYYSDKDLNISLYIPSQLRVRKSTLTKNPVDERVCKEFYDPSKSQGEDSWFELCKIKTKNGVYSEGGYWGDKISFFYDQEKREWKTSTVGTGGETPGSVSYATSTIQATAHTLSGDPIFNGTGSHSFVTKIVGIGSHDTYITVDDKNFGNDYADDSFISRVAQTITSLGSVTNKDVGAAVKNEQKAYSDLADRKVITGSKSTQRNLVPGMSKYTDSSFGFSFWYPSSLPVQKSILQINSNSMVNDSVTMNGPNTKILGVISAPDFTAYEVYSPEMSVLSSVDSGCCGSNIDKYFFDPRLHTWMEYSDGGPSGKGTVRTFAADVSKNTMGGLHILYGYTRFGKKVIIPLSAQHFLSIYSKCNDATDYVCNESDKSRSSGINRFDTSIQTILATDPSVATPVSITEQIKRIQAEKDANIGK